MTPISLRMTPIRLPLLAETRAGGGEAGGQPVLGQLLAHELADPAARGRRPGLVGPDQA
jgi:hypothetical protein